MTSDQERYPTENDVRDQRILDLECETGSLWAEIKRLKRQMAEDRRNEASVTPR